MASHIPPIFDQTGHLTTCKCKNHINRPFNNIKPQCSYIHENGQNCGSQLCYLGCLQFSGNQLLGFCANHWRIYCAKKLNWSDHLSYCANVKCDLMKIDLANRLKINPANIEKMTGISNIYDHVTPIVDKMDIEIEPRVQPDRLAKRKAIIKIDRMKKKHRVDYNVCEVIDLVNVIDVMDICVD